MNEQIMKLAEQLRKMREEKRGTILSCEGGSKEYRELVKEINFLTTFGERRIHEEQAKLRMVHQVISSGMWSMDFNEEGEMEKVVWSPEFRSMLGFEDEEDFPDELEAWEDRLHPKDKEYTMRAYWHTVNEAGKYDVEYRLLTKQGEYRWFHAIGETNRWKNGRPQLFIGVFIDITQRKEKEKAQEVLREVRRELKIHNEILNALCADFNSIYTVNLDTGAYEIYLMADSLPTAVSEISTANMQYDVAMEQYISRWVTEEDAPFVRLMTERERVKQVMEEKKRVSFRYHVKDREDGQKNFEFCFCDISKNPGEHMVVLGARNVDSLVDEKEDYRRDALTQVEETLAGAQTGLWSIEAEEGKPFRMYGDQTLKGLIGMEEELSPEEYYKEWFGGIEDDYIDNVLESLKKSMSGEFQETVYPCSYPERGRIYIRFGAVLDKTYKGNGYRLRGYYQDITETMKEKKLREEALVAALMEAKQASRVKTEFLSHMSHDIRTPINGILGLLTIAEKEINNEERQRDCYQKIRKSAEHLLSLVNDVLDISRMESGKHTLTEEVFELGEVLDSSMSVIRAQAELEGLLLQEKREKFRHSRLRGSSLHLRQILINILGNAVKYNKKNGSILIDTRELQEENGKVWFQFKISDTGIGMSEEYQKHIFEPFTQADSGARTAYSGSGLGMAITKKLVTQMGGTIFLESILGRGSVFTVKLPFVPEEEEESLQKREEAAADISGMKVLAAEDNELNREIMQYLLEDAGAEVVTAENGKEALDIFEKSSPGTFDCIIMDVMMPVMDGLEATRRLRVLKRPDAQSIPVIAVSANAFREDIERSKEAGVNCHISKPVKAGQLFQAMTELAYEKER